MTTVYELIYAASIMLFVVVAEFVTLKKLENASKGSVEKVLKIISNPLCFIPAFIWAITMVMLIPKVFGFQLNFPGFYTGMALYFGFSYKYSKPKWRAHKDRITASHMQERGMPGTRVADLSVRKVSAFLPTWTLVIPYLLLAAVPVYLFVTLGIDGLLEMSNLTLGLIYLLGIGMSAFLTKQMFKLVQEPVDLRSEEPNQFASSIHDFIRKRIRSLLVFQITYCISTAILILTFVPFQAEGHHRFLNMNWVIYGSILFSACGVWIAVSSARGMAKLEEKRWATSPQQ